MYACSSNDVETIRWYARAKLNFNLIRDYDKRTPLHLAVTEGVQFILFKEMNLNVTQEMRRCVRFCCHPVRHSQSATDGIEHPTVMMRREC